MKKISVLAFGFIASASFYAITSTQAQESGNFVLDKNVAEEFQLKEALQNASQAETYTSSEESETSNTKSTNPQIIRKETENGYIEKILSPDGKVIAEKIIENDKVIKNVLNYYTAEGALAKRVTANTSDDNFYVEEFYPNGQIASSAIFINENNKLGKEHRYDYNGVLRQEIMWMLPQKETAKPLEALQTVRYGIITTYYPSGAKAAEFSVGKPGDNIFYDQKGNIIKKISDSEILNFSRENLHSDCQEKAVELSLEELVELYEDEGDISYNKCGLPYREAFVYEIVDTKGTAATKISYDETGQIRRITPYQNGLKEGVLQKFDASGNLSAEIAYQKGQKHGLAVGYFPTRQQAFKKEYTKGKVTNDLICYFPDGGIAAQFHYENGLKEGTAQINSPFSRELQFSKGVLLNHPAGSTARKPKSLLPELKVIDEKCLDIEKRKAEILADMDAKIALAEEAFQIQEENICQDLSAFKIEEGWRTCYDENKVLRARYTAEAKEDGYLNVERYAPDGKRQYEIPYFNQQYQGWVKKFDKAGNITAEVYYSQGRPEEESRSYYETGAVKNMLTQANGTERKIITGYSPNGALKFSVTYKDGKKNQVFMVESKKGKDIYIGFNEDKLENIREVNAGKPSNYIEYNFALGEYTINRDNELVRGGHLCNISSSPEETMSTIGEKELKELDVAAQKAADEYNLRNAIIPTQADKKQAQLAAKNIGPVAKPDIEDLTSSVEKESIPPSKEKPLETNQSKTEKFYYPNGNLHRSVKTKGGRTEEVKEYSKSGLLLTQTTYNPDRILIEKYSGSGAIRRKTNKSYDDNAIASFISREDFYDSGSPRYEITRKPESLLFVEKIYTPKGNLKEETIQQSPLSLITKEYDDSGNIKKQTETLGENKTTQEFNTNGQIESFSLNGKKMPKEMAEESSKILRNNAKVYNKGVLTAEIKADKRKNMLMEYYPGKILKTEIIFFNNGEISVKGYAKDGTLSRFAYLSPDGKLHIQKPEVRTIPNYRERWWVDYNNPNWIENKDKYSVKSINRLYLDTTAHILMELGWDIPSIMQELYKTY